MQKQIKRLVYNYRLNLLQKYFKNNSDITKEPVILSGHARGGTTWVFETLCKNSDMFEIWEPLDYKNYLDFYKTEIEYDYSKSYIPPWDAKLERFIKDVSIGNYISERLLQKNSRFKSYKACNRFAIKYTRLTPYLPLYSYCFPKHKLIQLERNPLAIISSQLRHNAWSSITVNSYERFLHSNLFDEMSLSKLNSILKRVSSVEETLAAIWALETIPGLNANSNNIVRIKYEDLFNDPANNFEKLFSFIGESYSSKVLENLNKPSSTTKAGSNILHEPKKQLETWKNHLSTRQEKNILSILEEFGFTDINRDFYTLKLSEEYVHKTSTVQ